MLLLNVEHFLVKASLRDTTRVLTRRDRRFTVFIQGELLLNMQQKTAVCQKGVTVPHAGSATRGHR